MDDDPDFTAWFVPWKDARPDGRTPVGWYTLADLMVAFDAGRRAGK